MIFRRSSTPSSKSTSTSKNGISLAPTATSKSSSGVNLVAPSLAIPAFDVVSPSDPCPLNLNGSTFPDYSSVQGTSSSEYHSSIDENDIVIAVMGPTGAGKSSFVNKAAGRKEVIVGDDLRSKTRAVQSVRCPHPDGRRNIVLVDTPGFDDTHLSDTHILKIIANWLKNTYQKNIKLSGLLYLHRISDVRLAGTPLRNLSVFRELCGNDNLKNIVLITTMWDELDDQSVGSKREEELLSSFWKGMIDLGSRTSRYQGTYKSVWDIIGLLDLEGSRQTLTPLEIQREMVDRGLEFHETAAAKTLLRFLMQISGEFKKAWAKMRNGTRRAASPRKTPGVHRRNIFPSRSPTIRSNSSEISWSTFSLTDTSSIVSRDSRYLSSPVETTSSGCSGMGRRDALLATITGLKLLYQVADISSFPLLRGTIGTVLHIAQMVEGMGGTHHVMSQVIENSGWLLEEITHHVAESQLSRDMRRTLGSFQRELGNLQKVVMKIKERNPIARFFLHEADIRAMKACNDSIKTIYDKFEIKLAIDGRQAIARLEDQLTELYNSTAVRQCECGMSVVHEEPRENEERFETMSQYSSAFEHPCGSSSPSS